MRAYKGSLGAAITGGLREEVTAWAGAAVLAELYRKAGVEAAVERSLPKKKSPKGVRQGQMVEVFVLLSALGGECLEDMERLRTDGGLAALLGYRPPAAETARQWLDRFHDDDLMAQGVQSRFNGIPAESGPLVGLREANRQVVRTYAGSVPPTWEVTLDVDAELVETSKANAQYCYEGYRAFQPIEVVWAETGLVLADEFRAGNVLAGQGMKEIVDAAYEMLPPGPWRVRVRSDSAAYQQEVLGHWQKRGWEFAVSADMSRQLRKEIEALPSEAWKVWKIDEEEDVVWEWAEVPFVPTRKREQRDAKPYRYVAIRVRRQQGNLFADGVGVRHFAVVTNRWDLDGQALLEWQRGKAGTIEHVHHILKSELAGGVYPSAKHGANAAWLRLQVLTHNLLQLLKAVALPPEYSNARPKRLRFAVFTQFGRVVSHAGQVLVRIATAAWEALTAHALRRIEALSPG
jgi:hypothetical protein